jgi:hypothetical protein
MLELEATVQDDVENCVQPEGNAEECPKHLLSDGDKKTVAEDDDEEGDDVLYH